MNIRENKWVRKMTESQPVEKLVPRIVEQYTEHPRGWRVIHTPTGDMLIFGPDVNYQLRLIELSPFSFTGVGMEIDAPELNDDEITAAPEFGLRPLDENDIHNLIAVIMGQSSRIPQIGEIVRRTPVSPAQLERSDVRHILSGPVLSRPDLTAFSPEVIRRQYELKRQAMTIFRERYPQRAGMYF